VEHHARQRAESWGSSEFEQRKPNYVYLADAGECVFGGRGGESGKFRRLRLRGWWRLTRYSMSGIVLCDIDDTT
jgi:hypothetical protein